MKAPKAPRWHGSVEEKKISLSHVWVLDDSFTFCLDKGIPSFLVVWPATDVFSGLELI